MFRGGVTRRSFIAGGAALLGAGCLGSGETPNNSSPDGDGGGLPRGNESGSGYPPPGNTEFGGAREFGGGEIRSFVTRGEGLSYVGVEFTSGVLEGLPEERSRLQLELPDAGVFSWVAVDWRPDGHSPPGVYDVPHLDFRFYLATMDDVSEVRGGPANYSIPTERIPGGYGRFTAVDTDGDGEPDRPLVSRGVGERLLNRSAPEIPEALGGDGQELTHGFAWGAVGDGGTGRLAFLEPKVTPSYLEGRRDATGSISHPREFYLPGTYPTTYSIQVHEDDRYTVTLQDFR